MSTPSTDPLAIGVITGSTRPGAHSLGVARWVVATAADRPGVHLEVIDLADQGLPLLDEPLPAKHGRYEHAHTKAWASVIAPLDGFVFVTPEYNHSIPGALKNAIDFLAAEWEDKVAALVTYGVDAGGARAAEHLRVILSELHVAPVRSQVALSLFDDFVDFEVVAPRPNHAENLAVVLDQVERWGHALRAVRVPAGAA
jgi:NAD(P)H-dependent FMN reductase